MAKALRIAIAQINSTVGDIDGNAQKILEYVRRAKRLQADIVTFPELSLCGYPPEDLLLNPSFIEENLKNIKRIAGSIDGITAVVGFVDKQKGSLYNAAALIAQGKIKGVHHKIHLPNYSVFDEKRYFKEGKDPLIFKIGDICCGINICEDIWYSDGPLKVQARKGAGIIFAINASPYYMGKIKERERVLNNQARKNKVFISYTNLVGGQDELIFDGQSFIVDDNGRVAGRAEAFKDDLLVVDVRISPKRHIVRKAISIKKQVKTETVSIPKRKYKSIKLLDEVYQALILGLKDYVSKNRFERVLIGLSGGIDSALTTVIAKEALGRNNTIGVLMPSAFTSKETNADAVELGKRLGIRLFNIPIGNMYEVYLNSLAPVFKGYPENIAEENIQARIRGNILMAISNKFGYLVLTTGNKSEVSCGYCTLYGDMAGGFSVIKDVPKTLVYKLANDVVNRDEEIIPKRIIERAPTAELKPGQKDTDTLPPYELLDPIVEAYVEEDKALRDIVRKGSKKSVVAKVIQMIDRNEYKRRQAPPGIKITPKAFGKDRRMPITNRFVEK
ncbi:MAG: NAD+ synthase [Candidatus Omnitrophica bacterium]|nr:NAD+ synthase [Candidatus Omnitrophota bacterium]